MATVSVDVDIDLFDFDTDDLVEEVKRRARKGDREAKAALGEAVDPPLIETMSAWEMDKLRDAVFANDGARTVDILRPLIAPYPLGSRVLPFKRVAA